MMFRVRITELMIFNIYVFEYVYRLTYISFYKGDVGCTVSVFNTIINYL